MKNDKDDEPLVIDTMIRIRSVKWNSSGSVFAVCGQSEESDIQAIVQFYSNTGIHLKTLRVAGSQTVSNISWDGSDLRIALTVNSAVYFANIKPYHKWAYMSNGTLAFTYLKTDRVEYGIIFWDTIDNKKNQKFIKNFYSIQASGNLCCIITKLDNIDLWQIDLCNSIGSMIYSKQINIEPVVVTMTKRHIIVCSSDNVYIWQYQIQAQNLTTFEQQTGNRSEGKEQAWYIDQVNDLSNLYDKDTYDIKKISEDAICAVAANQQHLLVARSSGTINIYTLPQISLENKLKIKTRPSQMSLNKDSTRLAVIDNNNSINLLKITQTGGELLPFEKKDCWFVKYSEDIPESFVLMEKSRMHIVNDETAEEPIQTEGYVYQYQGYQVKIANLNNIMMQPEGVLNKEELLIEKESNILKDIKEQFNQKSMADMLLVIKQHNNDCLWKLYIKKALDVKDFCSAENAFVEIKDDYSLKFLQRIREIDDQEKQRAEINSYLTKIQNKEVYSLDPELQNAFELGNQYAENSQWEEAVKQYTLAKYNLGVIEVYTHLQDYESLEKYINEINERNELLQDLGKIFQVAGRFETAVKCYERFGDIQQAINCYVLQNNWNLAEQLARKYNFEQIEGLIIQNASQLLEKNRYLKTAQFCSLTKRNIEAAKILSQIADNLIERDVKQDFNMNFIQ